MLVITTRVNTISNCNICNVLGYRPHDFISSRDLAENKRSFYSKTDSAINYHRTPMLGIVLTLCRYGNLHDFSFNVTDNFNFQCFLNILNCGLSDHNWRTNWPQFFPWRIPSSVHLQPNFLCFPSPSPSCPMFS